MPSLEEAKAQADARRAAKKVEPSTETETKKPSTFKIFIGTIGALFAVSHIGLIGYVIHRPEEPTVPQVPTINIPRGDYSSYSIKAGKDGYQIEYKANDPAILESEKSLRLNQERKGFFGRGGTEMRDEYRRDQYTMDGTRNIGGEIGEVGKTGGVSAECIAADAGARSQGAMAGSAIAAGVAVPAVASIPYVGWLAGGWALLLGQKAGSSLGSTVGGVFNDC
jgi:hypothetical protein